MQNRLFPLPREFLEDSPKLDDGYPLSPLHSNATSENQNISSLLDTFSSDEKEQQNDQQLNSQEDNLNLDNFSKNQDAIIKKMGQMLASTIFVYAYLNASKWTLNWIARHFFNVKGEMFSWNIYKLIQK